MLYTYVRDPHYVANQSLAAGRKKLLSVFSLGLLLAGVFLVAQVVYPIVSWSLFLLPGYSWKIVSPLASGQIANVSQVTSTVHAQDISSSGSQYLNRDSYQPSSWFPQAKPFVQTVETNLKVYSLSIPKLKIDNATVEIGGNNLKQSLIAWPTSAPPGGFGVNIIFGHSELPQFANPKDYSGIFTFIMDLVEGDVIYVDYDGVRYKYLVVDKKVVDPEDISVLEQRFDDRYLTLITCVPPGTLWKRGIVKAKLSV